MVSVRRSIHIDASVEGVFELIADPSVKSELNPLVSPICIEVENGMPLHKGSHCHYRLQFGNSILDYSSDVTRFEKNHLIESKTDSDPPVQIIEEITPEAGGVKLTQVETFEVNEAILDSFAPRSIKNRVLSLAYRLVIWLDIDVAKMYQSKREVLLQEELGDELGRWLSNIKYHLENSTAREVRE